jgi:acetolactate synthase-1/2/3 large subunit
VNTSDVIAAYLAECGIGHVFGYPGDPSVEVIEALRRRDIDFVLARREGTAALMAEAYGALTGKPGVCLSTLGPGSSNLVNGVATALLDRVPMLAVSGQIASPREALFTHQVLDHNRLFGPISKWTASVRADNIAGIMRRALRTAVAERPGPVHLTTPADVVGADAGDPEIVLPPLTEHRAAATFSVSGDEDATAALARARRPIILAGIAAVRQRASPEVATLAERLGAPVVVAPMAKGVVAEDHPLFAGTLDMACNQMLWDFLKSGDFLVCVGFDAVELIKPWSVDLPTLFLDTVANTDQIVAARWEWVGHLPTMLSALAHALGGEPRWAEAEIRRHREGLFAAMEEGRVAGRLNPTDVVRVLRAALPRETLISTDVGSHKLLVGQGWTTYRPGGVLMTNGLSSMGYALPAAMIAKLLHPATPVCCTIGDGGLAMVQGELRLASTLKLGFTTVVFCDDSLNRIELKQAVRQYPATGTRLDPTDVAKLAESMGCDGIEVESETALADALGRQASDRPLVIGAKIDPAQYLAQF